MNDKVNVMLLADECKGCTTYEILLPIIFKDRNLESQPFFRLIHIWNSGHYKSDKKYRKVVGDLTCRSNLGVSMETRTLR